MAQRVSENKKKEKQMSLIEKTKNDFLDEIDKYARRNVLKKLEKAGVNPDDIAQSEFNGLVEDEKKILQQDAKKVGMGIGIGIVISMLTGI
jgi:hypothetical protein